MWRCTLCGRKVKNRAAHLKRRCTPGTPAASKPLSKETMEAERVRLLNLRPQDVLGENAG